MNMRDKLKASSLENNEVHSGSVDYDLLNPYMDSSIIASQVFKFW